MLKPIITPPTQSRQRARDKIKKWASQVPAYLILGFWSLFTIFIILWVMMSSLKIEQGTVSKTFGHCRPSSILKTTSKPCSRWTWTYYFLNSLVVVLISVFVILILSAPAAYVLSRKKFKGSTWFMLAFIAGIGIPIPLLFIPLFVILTTFQINNTLLGLGVLFIALSLPFTVFMLSGFFTSLPVELEEAAIIDGASDFQVFFRVMLPLGMPGLITAAIFNFIGLWNEYQLALVFLNDPDKSTLSLGLYSLSNGMEYTGDWVGLMAGVVIVMIPTIILYIILSEKMISGITMGAVKS